MLLFLIYVIWNSFLMWVDRIILKSGYILCCFDYRNCKKLFWTFYKVFYSWEELTLAFYKNLMDFICFKYLQCLKINPNVVSVFSAWNWKGSSTPQPNLWYPKPLLIRFHTNLIFIVFVSTSRFKRNPSETNSIIVWVKYWLYSV